MNALTVVTVQEQLVYKYLNNCSCKTHISNEANSNVIQRLTTCLQCFQKHTASNSQFTGLLQHFPILLLYKFTRETGAWPNDFMESVIIPIEKKSGAQECVDIRTISLVSHASKIILKILTRR